MARHFRAGTNDAVIIPNCGFKTLYDNAIYFWWYPTFDQDDGLDHFVVDTLLHWGHGRFCIGKFADNKLGGGISYYNPDYETTVVESSGYNLVQNAWNHVYFGFGGSGGVFYLNGEQIGSDGGGMNPYAGSALTVGNNQARNASAAGHLAEICISGRGYVHDHILALYHGMAPREAHSCQAALAGFQYAIRYYLPLWGTHNPEFLVHPQSPEATVYGAPRFDGGPPCRTYTTSFWKGWILETEPFVPPDPEALGGPNAVLVIPDEGEVVAQQIIMGMAQPEDLWLRLFTNDYTPNELTTRTSFVEPDASCGYAPITLTKNTDWTFTAGAPTPAVATSWSRTFAITSTAGNIYGFWVEGKVSHKVYWAARYTAGPQYIGTSGGEVVIPPRVSATGA